jgi:hypothetical protein
MGASFAKNESNAAKRRCDLIVYGLDGVTPAARGTSFAGFVYISQSSSNYVASAGTFTNKRRPLTFSALTIASVDTANDRVNLGTHNLETGDGPIRLTTTGGLPAPLAVATDYYVIKYDATNISFATTLANAYAGTKIDLTTAGSGTNQVVTATTFRGMDGLFTYEATQAETNFDGSEFTVIVENLASFSRSFTSVAMLNAVDVNVVTIADAAVQAIWGGTGALIEGSAKAGDCMRLLNGVIAGKVSDFRTGTQVFKSLDGSKTRLTGTVDASGRLTITLGDLT